MGTSTSAHLNDTPTSVILLGLSLYFVQRTAVPKACMSNLDCNTDVDRTCRGLRGELVVTTSRVGSGPVFKVDLPLETCYRMVGLNQAALTH